MATAQRKTSFRDIEYPTGDGKPMAETEVHLRVMMALIQILDHRYENDPMVYVGGDLLIYPVEGRPKLSCAPDVFLVKGVPKLPLRDNFFVWKEGKGPDVVIEVTSKSTRIHDQKDKFTLYRDVLCIPEYFQFDPKNIVQPPLQGFHLEGGKYREIPPIEGRLPSEVLGLHLERDGASLRLFDPIVGRWLLTPAEKSALAEAENRRLRQEIEELRQRLANG